MRVVSCQHPVGEVGGLTPTINETLILRLKRRGRGGGRRLKTRGRGEAFSRVTEHELWGLILTSTRLG